jgi:hypothetical protein
VLGVVVAVGSNLGLSLYAARASRPNRACGSPAHGSRMSSTDVLDDACLVGEGRRPAAAVRWDSNPVPCCFAVRGRTAGPPVTCGSHLLSVTARAHRGPAVPDAVRTQHGPESPLVLGPEGHGTCGGVEDRHGVDLGPRLGDASGRPLTDEGERSGRWQRPDPVLHIPDRAAAASAVLMQHRPVWLVFRVVGGWSRLVTLRPSANCTPKRKNSSGSGSVSKAASSSR